MKIQFNKSNKWHLEIQNKGISINVAIPPREEGFDYIDRNFVYHYNYKGLVSGGIIIRIEDSIPQFKYLSNYCLNIRYYRLFKHFNNL